MSFICHTTLNHTLPIRSKCHFTDTFCKPDASVLVAVDNAATSPETCHKSCQNNNACKFFTFLQHRGIPSCSLLSSCTFSTSSWAGPDTSCPGGAKCASGPKTCECAKLARNPPNDSNITVFAHWTCGDLDPYYNAIPSGTVCQSSCDFPLYGSAFTMESECLRDGSWTPAISKNPSGRINYSTYSTYPTPDQKDTACGCYPISFEYDPNEEEEAAFTCEGAPKNFKENWEITARDTCNLYCSGGEL